MTLYTRILLVLEGAPQPTPALHRALALARASGASLHVLLLAHDARIEATAELVSPEVQRLASDEYLHERRGALARLLAGQQTQGLALDSEVRWAPRAHESVIARALALDADVVIKDLQRERFLGRWSVIKPSDWKLLRLCPVPLMLVQPDSPPALTRIAAAVAPRLQPAGEGLDDAVVRNALRLARYSEATLDLVHSYPFLVLPTSPMPTVDLYLDQLEADDRAGFTAFCERHGAPPECRHLLLGDPASRVIEFVDEHKIQLIALGSQYRTGLDRFLLGGTAENILSHTHADVLLVQPEGFLDELARHVDLKALRARDLASAHGALP